MNSHNGKDLKLWTPATYRIKVQGYLDESRSDFLGGMTITTAREGDQEVVTTHPGGPANRPGRALRGVEHPL